MPLIVLTPKLDLYKSVDLVTSSCLRGGREV
jgi:hypothetical protein